MMHFHHPGEVDAFTSRRRGLSRVLKRCASTADLPVTEMRAEASWLRPNAVVNRLSEIADVVVMRYRLGPNPGIDFVSPSSLPILGYRPEEFYESPALGLEIVHPDDRQRLARECARDPEAPFVGRAIRKDGEVRWIERRQSMVTERRTRRAYLEATLRDVTLQQEAAEALRESEDRWQAVFDAAQDVFLLADDERTVVAANAAAADFFGVPVEEIVGCKVDEFTTNNTEQRWAAMLRDGSLRVETVWRRPDGGERCVRVSATANVAPGRHLAVAHDITTQDHGLTQRQIEILQLLAEGKSTRQIAEELYLSGTTVRNHIARLLANLGVHTRVQAVVAGNRLGLINLPSVPDC
jgi:PAS domain S-box-containing protein